MNKQRKIAFIVLFSLIFSIFSFSGNVSAFKNGDVLGNVLHTDIKTYVDNYRIPSYNINNKSAIILSDLANYGFDVVYNSSTRTSTVTLNPNKPFTPITTFEDTNSKPSGTVAFQYVYSDIRAVVNGKTVESFNIKGYLAIFFEDLRDYGTFSWNSANRESRFTSNKPANPVTGISLDRTAATVRIGDTFRLTATVSPSNASNKTVTWTSSNTNVATVDSSGYVRGIAAGTATITVTSSNGLTARCTITVQPAGIDVTSITLSKTAASLETGKFTTLTAALLPSNATDKTVTWTSSNTNVARVSDGYVMGIATGTATITATSSNGLTARCTVSVTSGGIDITGIALDKSTATVRVNETVTLTPVIVPSTAADKTVTWTSSNTNIATVNTSGIVRGISTGTITITATAANGMTAKCSVIVEPAGVEVTGISLDKSSDSVAIGEYTRLTATITPSNATDKTVTWTSSNTNVARVSDGYVFGVAAGSVTITAKTVNGYTRTCSVTVTASTTSGVTGVSISPTSTQTVTAGSYITLTAIISPSSASDQTVIWVSSDTTIATVNTSGRVTGVAAGKATIFAIASNRQYATRYVTVTDGTTEVLGVNLSSTAATINVGGSVTLTPTVNPSNATYKTVTWSSSNSTVATVNSNGVVTGQSAGSATIIATTSNGKFAVCTVTVANPPTVEITGITIGLPSASIILGENVSLTATVYPLTAPQTVTWLSSNPSIADITSSGLLVATGIGTVTITATSSDGKFSAGCTVTVIGIPEPK